MILGKDHFPGRFPADRLAIRISQLIWPILSKYCQHQLILFDGAGEPLADRSQSASEYSPGFSQQLQTSPSIPPVPVLRDTVWCFATLTRTATTGATGLDCLPFQQDRDIQSPIQVGTITVRATDIFAAGGFTSQELKYVSACTTPVFIYRHLYPPCHRPLLLCAVAYLHFMEYHVIAAGAFLDDARRSLHVHDAP